MFLVQLIQEAIALLQGILGHFVTGSPGHAQLLYDYEWTLVGAGGTFGYSLSNKGNYLAGAVADIITYGAILVDWIIQGLLNQSVNAVSYP